MRAAVLLGVRGAFQSREVTMAKGKMVVGKSTQALALAADVAKAAKTAPVTLDVKLVHSEHWPAAQKYAKRAASLVIGDKASHAGALKEVTEGGALDRKIAAFWKPIKQSIDRVKNAVLDLEKEERAAVTAGRDPLEERCVAWKRIEDARVEAAERVIREANEVTARAAREVELKAAEDAAAAIEAESPDLSAKELWFVTKVFEQDIDLDSGNMIDLTAMSVITKQAGYADPRGYAERLAKSEKIRTAVADLRSAAALREQAAALREQPIVVPAPEVESNLGTFSGAHYTKNYTFGGFEAEGLAKFIAAYKAGELPDEAMVPDLVHLRRMAKDLKEKFPQSYPGCTLKFEEGVAG
jgi:hypothetical protein